jgi:hypothetical protein
MTFLFYFLLFLLLLSYNNWGFLNFLFENLIEINFQNAFRLEIYYNNIFFIF